jgi:hypothetical protein
VAYPVIIGRLLEDSPARQLRAIPRPAITTIVLFLGATWMGQRVTASTWVTLVLFGGATAMAALLGAGYLGLTRGQRETVVARIRKIARGGRGREPQEPADEGSRP